MIHSKGQQHSPGDNTIHSPEVGEGGGGEEWVLLSDKNVTQWLVDAAAVSSVYTVYNAVEP